jgi:hypothetical protein
MLHLPSAHHETSKHNSPNETEIKVKLPKYQWTHHNQTKELTTWFLNLSLDESIDNKNIKFEV